MEIGGAGRKQSRPAYYRNFGCLESDALSPSVPPWAQCSVLGKTISHDSQGRIHPRSLPCPQPLPYCLKTSDSLFSCDSKCNEMGEGGAAGKVLGCIPEAGVTLFLLEKSAPRDILLTEIPTQEGLSDHPEPLPGKVRGKCGRCLSCLGTPTSSTRLSFPLTKLGAQAPQSCHLGPKG